MRYYDQDLKSWHVEDFVGALRGDDIEYFLDLRTKEENYEHDRVIFEAVAASFTLTAGEYVGGERKK